MSEYTVRIVVDSSGAVSGASKASQAISGVERAGRGANQAMGNLRGGINAVTGALKALAGAWAIREAIRFADSAKLITARLSLVSGSTREVAQAQGDLFNVAQRTRTGFEAVSELYVKLSQSAGGFAKSNRELVGVTEAVSQALQVSGASAAGADATMRQLSQAFGSGVLRGDEFNSVMENAPRLAKLFADGLKVPVGALRSLAQDGKLTADKLYKALTDPRILAGLKGEFDKLPLTVGGAFTKIENSLLKLSGEFEQKTGFFTNIAKGIDSIATSLSRVNSSSGGAVTTFRVLGQTLNFLLRNADVFVPLVGGVVALRTAWAALNIVMNASPFVRTINLVAALTGGFSALYLQIKNYNNAAGAGIKGASDYASTQDIITKRLKDFSKVTAENAFQERELANAKLDAAKASLEQLKSENKLREGRARALTGKDGKALPGKDNEFRSQLRTILENERQQKQLEKTISDSEKFIGRVNDKFFPKPKPFDPDAEKKAKEAEKNAEKAAKAVAQLKDEYKSLLGSLDPAIARQNKFNEELQTLKDLRYGTKGSKENPNGTPSLIGEKEYQDRVALLNKATIADFTAQTEQLANQNKELQFQLAGRSDLIALSRQELAYEEQKKGLNDTQIKLLDEQLARQKALIAEQQNLNKAIEQQAEFKKIADNAAENLQRAFSERFKNIFDSGIKGFKGFGKQILGIFKDTFSEILAARLFGGLREQISNAILGGIQDGQGGFGLIGGSIGQVISGLFGGSPANNTFPGVPINAINGSDASLSASNATSGVLSGAARTQQQSLLRSTFSPITNTFSGLTTTFRRTFSGLGQSLDRAFGLGGKLGAGGYGPPTPGLFTNLGGFAGTAASGAVVGGIVSSIGKLFSNKFSTTGSTIGGAVGSFLPIPGGNIIGSVAGGLIGSLFKKTPQSAISLSTGADGSLAFGSSYRKGKGGDERLAGNREAGQSIIDSLNKIAEQLGGSVRSGFNLGSLGTYKDKFTFDPTGTNQTKKASGQFSSAEDAAKAALRNAIDRGVFAGITEQAQRLLRVNQDIDAGVSKAVKFESIIKEIGQSTDPARRALEGINDQFKDFYNLFKEAGATAQQYADLEKYYTKTRQDAIDQQISQIRDFQDSLTKGPLSSKTAFDQLQSALGDFAKFETDIAAKKSIDQSQFTSSGQNIIELARGVFGSATPEFEAIKKRLVDASASAISVVQSASASTAIDTAQLQQLGMQTQYLSQIASGISTLISYSGGGGGSASARGDYVRRQAY